MSAGFAAKVPLDVTADWTISPNAKDGEEFTADYSLSTNPEGIEASTEFFIDPPVAVPEPSETMAGGFLLVCSGVVFAGRRLLKKQAPV